ncbi:MAG: hypothetical protein WCE61_21225 [Candidatus Acidiferrum sp.]
MRFFATQFCALALSLLLIPPAFAIDTPLSDEAVRDAYFLGQRHEQDFTDLMAKYTKTLPMPKTGPDISSITFLTPFALVAQLSSQRTMGYSAQQAEQDHRNRPEIVRVIIQIQLTPTYGALVPHPTSPYTDAPSGYDQRPSDFWKDFQVAALVKDESIPPVEASGVPTYVCGRHGGCTLTGATLHFDYPADAFTSDSATIQIFPPEGDTVSVDFDLASLR